jgi:hypothetical protein
VTAAPAVVVHDAAQASAALAAAGPDGVVLLSAPAAAGNLGSDWFRALLLAAAASHPGVRWDAALDCGAAPGHVLGALRGGLRLLVLDPGVPGFARLSALVAAAGGTLWTARPPALDLGRVDLRRPGGQAMLAQWLCSTPDDTRDTNG